MGWILIFRWVGIRLANLERRISSIEFPGSWGNRFLTIFSSRLAKYWIVSDKFNLMLLFDIYIRSDYICSFNLPSPKYVYRCILDIDRRLKYVQNLLNVWRIYVSTKYPQNMHVSLEIQCKDVNRIGWFSFELLFEAIK